MTNNGIPGIHSLFGVEEVKDVGLVLDAGGSLQFSDQFLDVSVGHGGDFLATSLLWL